MSLDAAAAYRRLAPRVLAYLRGQGALEPEDLLGEVFLQVARDAHRFRGSGPDDERRWILRIARNRMFDARRAAGRRPATPTDPVELSGPAVPPPALPFDHELVSALTQITDDQRDVVLLRFVLDLPLADVAELVGREVDAVKQLQRRGLRSLRAVLEGSPAPPPSD